MRIAVLADNGLVPANSGGRLAVYNECAGLARAGAEVFVLSFVHEHEVADPGEPPSFLAGYEVVSRRRAVRATLRHPLEPYQVSSRRLHGLDSRQPYDAVIAHHEWTLPCARALVAGTGAPLYLRLHNDEVAYYSALAAAASGRRRLYLRAEALRVRRHLAPRAYDGVTEAWAMSADDAAATRRRADCPVRVVPPALLAEMPAGRTSRSRDGRSVLFIGALDVPHAVEGLTWFLVEVWPRLRDAGFSFTVAGRRPVPVLRQLVTRAGARLVADPVSTAPLLEAADAFVNPVFAGSGVNYKLGEPSAAGLPIVSTSFGLRGLEPLRPGALVADTARSFGDALEMLAGDERAWAALSQGGRDAARGYTGEVVAASLLATSTVAVAR